MDAMSDEMTRVLGAFLTEVGDVEYVMFETILAVATNDVHAAFYNETFGGKVTMLEERLKHSAFDKHRASLNHLLRMLKKLNLQRNNIIHGETFVITPRRRGETKVFRVGFTRKNFKPWKNFKFKGNAKNKTYLHLTRSAIGYSLRQLRANAHTSCSRRAMLAASLAASIAESPRRNARQSSSRVTRAGSIPCQFSRACISSDHCSNGVIANACEAESVWRFSSQCRGRIGPETA